MSMNIGFVIADFKETNRFIFEGMDFPSSFILSRLGLRILSILLLLLAAPIFHRFNIKEHVSRKKQKLVTKMATEIKTIDLSSLPITVINYSMFPLIKAECLLLFRKGKRWLWIVNGIGVVVLAVLPLQVAHQIVLPILWFIQVSRLSSLTTKETIHRVQHFAFTSFQPLSRLFVSQLIAGILLMLILALPLLIRLGLLLDYTAVIAVILGALFIVLLAATLGILTKGKKLFEVLFFMITYANINSITVLDYFGGFEHNTYYLPKLAITICILTGISILMRKAQLSK